MTLEENIVRDVIYTDCKTTELTTEVSPTGFKSNAKDRNKKENNISIC